MTPSNGPIHGKMDDGNGLTSPTLRKKMHDGNNLTDPSRG